MKLVQMSCRRCGADRLKIDGDLCTCSYCKASYRMEKANEYMEEIKSIFGEALVTQKEEQIANLRRNLWEAVYADNVSSYVVSSCAQKLKDILPEDFQANFCEIAVSGTQKQINAFLNKMSQDECELYADFIADFLLRSLESSNVLSLKDLIRRGLKGDRYTEYITKVENEAERVKGGIYSPQVPRDVFIAYSSKDYKAVNELVEYLEQNKISCFIASRNMRHGRGAVENYVSILKTAMHNCKCVVFLSSDNSRDLDCDALKVELPYIKDCEPEMGRIEYLIDEYSGKTNDSAKVLLKDFFDELERCRSKEDLISRILRYITGLKTNNKNQEKEDTIEKKTKYCVSCGLINPERAKFCMECGGNEFAATKEQYLLIKTEREQRERVAIEKEIEEQKRKTEQARKEKEEQELRKQKADEAARKAREEAELAAVNMFLSQAMAEVKKNDAQGCGI